MQEARSGKLGRIGFWAIALTVFMVAYNVGVLPAIMPAIARDFNTSIGNIQNTLVLFSLTTAAFAPSAENLCRFFGRTPIFLAGLVFYGLGIGLTALSPTMGILAVSFAVLTGLAATPLVSTPWTIIDLSYEGKSAEKATVVLIVASAAGGLTGGILGGFIAFHSSWRFSFLPSLVVLLGVWFLKRSLPRLVVYYKQPMDWVGGLLSFLGLGSILTAFSLAEEFGWWEPKRIFTIGAWVIPPFPLSIAPTLIAVGVILLGFFLFWQRRQARRDKVSLLRAGLLRKPGFVLATFTAMLHTLIVTGVQFNLFQYVPVALSLNPFRTSLAIMPYSATMIVVVVAVLRFLVLGDRYTPKFVIYSGIVLLGVGILLLYHSLDLQVTVIALIPGLMLMGIGSGLFLAYISKLAYAAVTEDQKPEGSGIYNPVQNLGSSLGRGILGTALIFFASSDIVDGILKTFGKTLDPIDRALLINELQEKLQTLSQQELSQAMANRLSPQAMAMLQPISLEAATSGMKTSLLMALMFAAVCFLLATTLPRNASRP
jgi:MFS family permease